MRFLLSVLLLCPAAAMAQNPPATPPVNPAAPGPAVPGNDQSYTLRTQSNIVLVPTTVQTKHADMLYVLKPNQFVVVDNGAPQPIPLDEDTDSLGLSLPFLVQCSRSSGYEGPTPNDLGTMT